MHPTGMHSCFGEYFSLGVKKYSGYLLEFHYLFYICFSFRSVFYGPGGIFSTIE